MLIVRISHNPQTKIVSKMHLLSVKENCT